jgi:hypothetical protein
MKIFNNSKFQKIELKSNFYEKIIKGMKCQKKFLNIYVIY